MQSEFVNGRFEFVNCKNPPPKEVALEGGLICLDTLCFWWQITPLAGEFAYLYWFKFLQSK